MSTVECPSHVARSPLSIGRFHDSRGFNDGSGCCGTRRSPPQMNSLIDGMATDGSPRGAWLELRNRTPSQRGDALMRSCRGTFGTAVLMDANDLLRRPIVLYPGRERADSIVWCRFDRTLVRFRLHPDTAGFRSMNMNKNGTK